MLEKLPGAGNGDKDNDPETDDLPSDITIQAQDLPRNVKMRLLFSEAPTTFRQMKNKWKNERVELYFLLFSVLAATGMLVLILFGRTYYVIGLFAFYTVIMIPLLYIHEEERYFQNDGELFK